MHDVQKVFYLIFIATFENLDFSELDKQSWNYFWFSNDTI